MAYQEKTKFATMIAISGILAATMAFMVSIYTYVDSSKKNDLKTEAIFANLASENSDLKEEIKTLKIRVDNLEKELNQNSALIQSLDNNVKFQVDVIKTLLQKEGKK